MLWRILTIVGAGVRASAIILNWQRRRHRARGTKTLNWKRSSSMEVELQVFPPPEPQAHDYEYVHPYDVDEEESSSLVDSQLGFESLSAMTTNEEKNDTLAQESEVKSPELRNETDHHQNSCGCNGTCASLADIQIQSQSQSSTFAEILLPEENLQDVAELKANCSEEDEAIYLLSPPQNNKSSGMHINLQSVKTSCVESPGKFEQVSGNYAEQEEFRKQCVAQELGQTLEYGQSGSTAEQKLENEIVEAEKPYVAKEFKEEKEIMENEFSELGMALAEEEEKLYAKELKEGEEGESSLKSFTCMSIFGEFFCRGFAAAGARATATILKWQGRRNRTTKKLGYKHSSFMEVEMQVYPPPQPQVHDYDHHHEEEDSSSFIDSQLGYESFCAMATLEEEHDALAEESEIKFKELDNETEHNKSCCGYHGSCASVADVDADSQSQSSTFAEILLPRENLEYVAEMEANDSEENGTNPTQKNISDMYVLEPVNNGCSDLGTLDDAHFEIKLDSIYESEADEMESISTDAITKTEERVDSYREEKDIKFEDGNKGIESEEKDKVGVSSFSGLEEVSVIPASSCFGVKKHPHQNHADAFTFSESPMKISSNEIMEEESKNEASKVKMPRTEQELEQEIAEAVKATAKHEREKESSEIGKTLAEVEELKENISKAGPASGDQNLKEEFVKVDKPDATQGFEEECFDADTFKEDGESSFIFGGQENVGAKYSYSSTEFFYHGFPVRSHRSRVSVRKSYADTNPAMQYRLLQMEMRHLTDLFLATLFTSSSNKPPTPLHSCV